jgi:hypothetical protein
VSLMTFQEGVRLALLPHLNYDPFILTAHLLAFYR